MVNHSKTRLWKLNRLLFCQVYQTAESRIRLQFRPGDVYCKSAYGTCYPTNSVLCKVKQKRHKKTGATKLCVELVGVIATTYKFNSKSARCCISLIFQFCLFYSALFYASHAALAFQLIICDALIID